MVYQPVFDTGRSAKATDEQKKRETRRTLIEEDHFASIPKDVA